MSNKHFTDFTDNKHFTDFTDLSYPVTIHGQDGLSDGTVVLAHKGPSDNSSGAECQWHSAPTGVERRSCEAAVLNAGGARLGPTEAERRPDIVTLSDSETTVHKKDTE